MIRGNFFFLLAVFCVIAISSPHISAMNPSAKIFAGTGSQKLTEKICKSYGTPMGKINIQKFSDGEIQPIFLESIRGDFVFLVQSTYSPADNLMELLLMIDAARRNLGGSNDAVRARQVPESTQLRAVPRR